MAILVGFALAACALSQLARYETRRRSPDLLSLLERPG
jgi:hypothetical protein